MRSDRRNRWTRIHFIIAAALLFAAFLVWLVLRLSQGDLDRSDKLANMVSMMIAAVTLPMTMLALVMTTRRESRAATAIDLSTRLDSITETLAIAIRTQWETEEQIRRIHDPFPLQARWTNAPDELHDHWQSIHGSPDRGESIWLDGRGDQIVETFNRVPSGRLVLLGRAGSGKTILASRFTLSLITQRVATADGPVPVIFSLGSWDPTTRSLRDWLCSQLVTNYPVLAEEEAGMPLAFHLLSTRRILPVLDGFDEIPDGLRVDAINGINASLRPGDRLLLTSRFEQYAAAVESGDVLTAGAVIEIADLTIEDLVRYLPLTTHKAGADTTRSKWHPVLDYLQSSPGSSALATVLSTPLMVALARAIFSDTEADPAELIDSRLPDSPERRGELEDRLLAGFIPAVYSRRAHLQRMAEGRTFDGDKAFRWLSFLADHMNRLGTYDLAWWRLILAVPRIVTGMVAGLLVWLVTWSVVTFVGVFGSWQGDSQQAWLAAGSVFAFMCGAVGGTLIWLGRGIRLSPARIHLRFRDRATPISHGLTTRLRDRGTMAWMAVWAGGGSLFGIFASPVLGSAVSVLFGLITGLFIGFGMWCVLSVVRALGDPVRPTETISPSELLRIDRITALRQLPLVCLGSTLVLWLAIWFAFEPIFESPFETVFGRWVWLGGALLTAAGGALIWTLFVTTWGPWLIARTWHLLVGRLPLPVMAFLADAHRRGVLRQAGGVYQFRHARLQDYLAKARRAGGPVSHRSRTSAVRTAPSGSRR